MHQDHKINCRFAPNTSALPDFEENRATTVLCLLYRQADANNNADAVVHIKHKLLPLRPFHKYHHMLEIQFLLY